MVEIHDAEEGGRLSDENDSSGAKRRGEENGETVARTNNNQLKSMARATADSRHRSTTAFPKLHGFGLLHCRSVRCSLLLSPPQCRRASLSLSLTHSDRLTPVPFTPLCFNVKHGLLHLRSVSCCEHTVPCRTPSTASLQCSLTVLHSFQLNHFLQLSARCVSHQMSVDVEEGQGPESQLAVLVSLLLLHRLRCQLHAAVVQQPHSVHQ